MAMSAPLLPRKKLSAASSHIPWNTSACRQRGIGHIFECGIDSIVREICELRAHPATPPGTPAPTDTQVLVIFVYVKCVRVV